MGRLYKPKSYPLLRGATRTTPTTRGTPPEDLARIRLKDILGAYEEAQGVNKLIVMVKLRDYLNRQDPLVVCDEVRTITDSDRLRVLIGAGPRGNIYYAVLAQIAYLMGVV